MTISLSRTRATSGSTPVPPPLSLESERFVFLLLDGFMLMSLASAVEALRLANHVSARNAYDWILWSVDGAPVSSSAGLPLPVHGAPVLLNRGDRLVVVGGSQHDLRKGFAKPLLSYLRRANAHGAQMIGLCTGALALSDAGVIDAGRCAVHWEYQQPLFERGDDIRTMSSAFTLGPVPTAAGGVAAAELILHLVFARLGRHVAARVADSLLLTSVRSEGEAQVASPLAHAGTRIRSVSAAVTAMEVETDDVLLIEEIAELAGVSVRQLERLLIFTQNLAGKADNFH